MPVRLDMRCSARLEQHHAHWMRLLGDHARFYWLNEALARFDDAFVEGGLRGEALISPAELGAVSLGYVPGCYRLPVAGIRGRNPAVGRRLGR